jgi:RHS repeat-associated protein
LVPPTTIPASIIGAALALTLFCGTASAKNDKVEVRLTGPSLATAPAMIALTATAFATQKNHPIAKVEFFQGDVLIGASTVPAAADQYVFQWTEVPAGTYSVTAKATNDKGDAEESDPVAIIVNAPPNAAIIQPATNAIFPAPALVDIAASATDSDGAIAKVDFYAGADLIGTATQPPYSIQWPNVTSGTYSLSAVATDNHGASSSSLAVTIKVNAAPTLSLTSPATNATLTAPANITLTAEASDSDGSIARVEFFSDNTLIATTSVAPFSIVWTGVPQGTYSLTAQATDDLGASVASNTVNITVNSAAAQLYFIHVDHLNTPRLVADEQQRTVWLWDQSEPFGANVADQNPSGLGAFDLPLRLPGQYFDKESGLHYNYFRDYDPSIARYVESDAIGLHGGPNPYVYANGPLTDIDPLGLMGRPGFVSKPGTGTIKKTSVCGTGMMTGPEFQFYGACLDHDKCFETCGRSKIECDDVFCDQVKNGCSPGNFVCKSAATLYCSILHSTPAFVAYDPAQRSAKCNSCKP